MIYLFHKIGTRPDGRKDQNWISLNGFKKFLDLNVPFVSLDQYIEDGLCGNVITFDGIYMNVFEEAFPYLYDNGIPFELFVTKELIGEDNSFDKTQPYATFCGINELNIMAESGFDWNHHGQTHDDFSRISLPKVKKQIENQFEYKRAKYFAYPYGNFNSEVVDLIKPYYKAALSVLQGDNELHTLARGFWNES